MTRNQKIELSREIRQWIGLGVGAATTIEVLRPGTLKRGFNKVTSIGDKFKTKKKFKVIDGGKAQ